MKEIIITIIILIISIGIGILALDKMEIDQQICQSIGAELKEINYTCGTFNCPKDSRICIYPNGTEIKIKEIPISMI